MTMFSRLFRPSNSIAAGAIILGLFSLVSRLLGLLRDRLLASAFGAGSVLDAYYAAFRIPDFVFNIIVLGALSAGFIPIFSELFERDRDKAWRFSQAVLLLISAGLLVTCMLLYAGMPWLIPVIAPGFNQETAALSVQLSRVMLLSPLFLGISSVFGGILQSFKRFFAYSLAPVFYNMGIIFGIVALVPAMGPMGLAWGVGIGAAAHLALQALVSGNIGWSWQWVRPWQQAGLADIGALMGPRTLSIALNEATLFIVTLMASGLPRGSLTQFSFAHNLAHLPIGLFGISFAVAAFPSLSSAMAQGRLKKFRKVFHNSISSLLVFLVPTVICMAVFSREIILLLLGSGKFGTTAVVQTAAILLALSGHMVAQSLLPIYARSYYAQKNTWYPLIAAAFGVALNAGLAFALSRRYGVVGLAVSLSLASTAQFFALMLGPQVKAAYRSLSEVRTSMLQSVLSGAVMLFILLTSKYLVGILVFQPSRVEVAAFLIVQVMLALTAYIALLRAFGSREYLQYKNIFQRKLGSFSISIPQVARGHEEDSSLPH